ncbi:hypothetical protein [Rhodoblastus sp.]|uniref:hypothetical protein n=1 Tax=Rhodoblastus sp. TaxID=1962975 RepID=UPI003F9E5F22
MTATPESQARTRAFARVIGPYLLIVPSLIVVKFPEAVAVAPPFFANPALVWITGALMFFGGVFIIANHQSWRGASAILISLFGWILALRALALLVAPQIYQHAIPTTEGALRGVRLGFVLVVLAGLKLTYDGWIVRAPAAR